MSIEKLREIMAHLRDPEQGCPWDKKQNFATIAPYTIEEAYEVADAIAQGSMHELKDELGDLLFQVVYHAQMASEQGAFDFDDVTTVICEKMIRRHPHVFGDESADSVEDVKGRWEQIKLAEKAARNDSDRPPSVLDGVARNLPALTLANKLQKKAARLGFDWKEIAPVFDKLDEEILELRNELDEGADKSRVEDELGDVLFTVVNLARHLGVDPENALRGASSKFDRRFRAVESAVASEGVALTSLDIESMDKLWVAAKSQT